MLGAPEHRRRRADLIATDEACLNWWSLWGFVLQPTRAVGRLIDLEADDLRALAHVYARLETI